jgi:hypothetical protein
LNQTKVGSPFANKNARLAVASCIDRANFVKVRSRGENVPADSLVGPSNIMYTKAGFSKFNVKKSKEYVAAYLAENPTKTKLEFSFPVSNDSNASRANFTFLDKQWKKCGITANPVSDSTQNIITNSFGSTKLGGEQMGYDSLALLLFEGTDVAFNLPFVVTNMFPVGSTNPVAGTFRSNLGTLLNLNHHTDAAVDKFFFDGQAAKTKGAARIEFTKGTQYLQENAFMTAIQRQYYSVFTSKKLAGVGKLSIEKGKTQRLVSNWGIDWTGVYKK